MDEYISRKEAIAYIREQSEECQKAFEELGGESGIYADAYNDLADNFCSIPAADVAPVTRCKACANFRQNASGACWCDEYGGAITPNDYCSRAATDKQPRASIPWEAD